MTGVGVVEDRGKIGILVASIVAAVAGALVFTITSRTWADVAEAADSGTKRISR